MNTNLKNVTSLLWFTRPFLHTSGTRASNMGNGVSPNSNASASEYLSTRIERLTQLRTEFATTLEYEIEASRDHWSDTVTTTSGVEREGEAETFEQLREEYPAFFRKQSAWAPGDADWVRSGWVVGEKLAEGAQGEIFEALFYRGDRRFDPQGGRKWVVKVFKQGASLQGLRQQWPLGMLQMFQEKGHVENSGYSCGIYAGLLLKNGRFAFLMRRYWGDLRKLIDLRMQHHRSSPFRYDESTTIMKCVALGMKCLHKGNVLHRDLKASNVLVWARDRDVAFDPIETDLAYRSGRAVLGFDVADFECSVGVVGTEFWRAPEVLQAVKSGVRPIPSDVFTEKSDAYSFAMTCYEVLTGRIPFEDVRRSEYHVVIDGARPTLPQGTEPWIQEMLSRCWHADPSQRPLFKEIVDCIERNSS
jgi:serine/threonine protein kinase